MPTASRRAPRRSRRRWRASTIAPRGRARPGRRVAGRCAPASAANRVRSRCRRYSRVLRTLRFDGERGDNAIVISSQAIGRRAGLLRLEATASGSESTRSSGVRRVHVRISRKR
ncbi:MAG: hypothetical protein WKF48_13225 [Solirubrobacteraceae bacterium]